MERYDEMIPKDMPIDQGECIILAAQITNAINEGVVHFKTGTYEPLLSTKEVLQEIKEKGSFISWHKSMGEDTVGLHDALNHKAVLIPIPTEIFESIKGLL